MRHDAVIRPAFTLAQAQRVLELLIDAAERPETEGHLAGVYRRAADELTYTMNPPAPEEEALYRLKMTTKSGEEREVATGTDRPTMVRHAHQFFALPQYVRALLVRVTPGKVETLLDMEKGDAPVS